MSIKHRVDNCKGSAGGLRVRGSDAGQAAVVGSGGPLKSPAGGAADDVAR